MARGRQSSRSGEWGKSPATTQQAPDQTVRHGSPEFYQMLGEMAEIHSAKSHDYANDSDPFGNYLFAGKMSKLFDDPDDAGFVGRIAEKLFRLANLENSNKMPKNETVEDTERDLCTIMVLWMAQRRNRRGHRE